MNEPLDTPLLGKIPELPLHDFGPGDRVWWSSRSLGRCIGVIARRWPRGYTAFRDGVRQTKPHFLALSDPRALP